MMNSQGCGKNQSDVLTRYLYGSTNPSGRAVYGMGLRPLAFGDCGFESHLKNVCLSIVSVVCCQAEISASG